MRPIPHHDVTLPKCPRLKLRKAETNREYKARLLAYIWPGYCEYDYTWKLPNMSNQKRRSYRSWKHNRKTRWKPRNSTP